MPIFRIRASLMFRFFGIDGGIDGLCPDHLRCTGAEPFTGMLTKHGHQKINQDRKQFSFRS
jgi:hypothetical protein